jgi:hypothetical protein
MVLMFLTVRLVRSLRQHEPVKAKHPQPEDKSNVYKMFAGGIGVPFVRWFVINLLDLFGFSAFKLPDLHNTALSP